MSEFNENIDDFEEEEQENYITLTDENGEDISFEIIGEVEYSERLFAVLIPFEDEYDGIVMLEILPTDDSEFDEFVAVEHENHLVEVLEKFKKEYKGEYEFE